jgi:GNAT superfamily N-acetyltransferase
VRGINMRNIFKKTNIEELNAIALLHNMPSNKVIKKSGFKHIGTIEVDNEKFNHYKLMKNSFIIEEASSEDEKFIANKIKEYNSKKTPLMEQAAVERIFKTMKDLEGNIIGGILSIINYYSKSSYIDILWIKEEYRKDGYGSILMDEVEREAKEKGVHLVNLDTFDFQAKDFYIKRGYEVYAVLDDCPVNHKRYYMRKLL